MSTYNVRVRKNKRRKLPELYDLVEADEVASKIFIYFSVKTAGDDFDPYEKNYVDTTLSPKIIKGYVREVSPEALVWKQYGLSNIGAKEILCRKQYKSYFANCSRVVIDDEDYEVFKEGTGHKSIISDRPYEMIRVVVTRRA